jgi:hypothetical protein
MEATMSPRRQGVTAMKVFAQLFARSQKPAELRN